MLRAAPRGLSNVTEENHDAFGRARFARRDCVVVCAVLLSVVGAGCELVGGFDDFQGDAGQSGSIGANGVGGSGFAGGGQSGSGGGKSGSGVGGQSGSGVDGQSGSDGGGGRAGGEGAGQGGGGAGGGGDVPWEGGQILSGGFHNCVHMATGELRCWGFSYYGQIGTAAPGTYSANPVPLLSSPGGPMTGVRAVASGYLHSCALLGGSQMSCWGINNYGQLGNGSSTDNNTANPTPTPVTLASGAPLLDVQSMALGYQHSCALLSGGRARCWGYNSPGSLGDGTGVDQLNPVVVMASLGVPLTGAQALASGGYHSCALMNNGQVICWGSNVSGQLGDGTKTNRVFPVTVNLSPGVPLTGVRALALGEFHSCALLNDDTV